MHYNSQISMALLIVHFADLSRECFIVIRARIKMETMQLLKTKLSREGSAKRTFESAILI